MCSHMQEANMTIMMIYAKAQTKHKRFQHHSNAASLNELYMQKHDDDDDDDDQ